MRFLALTPFQEGHSRTDIARFLKVSRTSVNKWVSNFLLHGVAGLDSVRPPGRPAKLGAEQLSQLSEYIDQQTGWPSGDDCKVPRYSNVYRTRVWCGL